MDLNTINNYQDWPDSALIELKKRDELIKSQKILITKLKSKLSLYCKHEKSGEIDNEEYLLDRNGVLDDAPKYNHLTSQDYIQAAIKIQRALRKYLEKKALIKGEKSKRAKDLIMKMTHENSDFISLNDTKEPHLLSNSQIETGLKNLLVDESSSHFEDVLEGIEADDNFDDSNETFNSHDEDEEDNKEVKSLRQLTSSSNNSTLRKALNSTETRPFGYHANSEATLKKEHQGISKALSSSSNSIYPPSPDLLAKYSSPVHNKSLLHPYSSVISEDYNNKLHYNIVDLLQQHNYKNLHNCCCAVKDHLHNQCNNQQNHFYNDDLNHVFYQSSLTLSSTSSSSSSCLSTPTPLSNLRFPEYQQQCSLDPALLYNNQVFINNNSTNNKLYDTKLINNTNNLVNNMNNTNNIVNNTKALSERNRKRLYRVGLNLFNKTPSKGIEYMIHHKFVEKHPRAIAKFLISRKGLSRKMIGEYLGCNRDHMAIDALRYLSEELDLTGLQIDVALRLFQSQFRISGEAQMIERFMQVFASRYCECNSHMVGKLFKTEDTVFLLSFAIIMLNTDLHNPSIKPDRRMTLQCFIKNLKGLDEGSDISNEMLMGVYERVKEDEFALLPDHTTQVVVLNNMITGLKQSLVTTYRRFVCHCRMDEIADVNKQEKPGSHVRGIFLFNDLLVVTKFWMRKRKESRHVMKHQIPLLGVSVYLLETAHYKHGIRLKRASDGLELLTLCSRDAEEQMRFVEDLKESILETEKMDELIVMSREVNRISKDSGVVDDDVSTQQQQSDTQQQKLDAHQQQQQNLLQQQLLHNLLLSRQHNIQHSQQNIFAPQHHHHQLYSAQANALYMQQQQNLLQQQQLNIMQQSKKKNNQQHQQIQLQNAVMQTLNNNNNNNPTNYIPHDNTNNHNHQIFIHNNNNLDHVFADVESEKRNSRTSVDSGLSSIGSFNNQQQLSTKTTASGGLHKKI